MADIHTKLLDEKKLRAVRARRRFKAAVRNVIYNYSWIKDEPDICQAIPSNSVLQASICRRKPKKEEGQLTLREISILRKHAKYRTEDEINLLNKYIGGFKCFRIYPEDVREELVTVTYFEYYGPKRVLIKENQEGRALYFLLTGEVLIYKLQLDIMSDEYVQVQVNKITAGNMFGEISLLHNIPRTATVVTSAPCQLLVLKKDDFDRVLKVRLMQQWQEVRESMQKFVYFDNWTAVAIQECCMLGSMESYKPNDVIYGDRAKKEVTKENTYFVVEGTCAIIEHLFIEKTVTRGRNITKIYEPPEPINVELPVTAPFSVEKIEEHVKQVKSNQLKHSYAGPDSPVPESQSSKVVRSKSLHLIRLSQQIARQEQAEHVESTKASLASIAPITEFFKESQTDVDGTSDKSLNLKLLQKSLRLDEDKNTGSTTKLPSNVKLRFMQICTLRELATFFEGKLMENRRVIALTPVKIMTIPVYWLMSHKGNVWSRIQEYQQVHIPSKQEVFKAYMKKQKWQEYRRKLRDDILSKHKFYNPTTIHDVPYSIRIMSSYND